MSWGNLTIGFIGCGAMGTAIASGLIEQKLLPPQQIIAYDVYAPASLNLQDKLGIRTASNIAELAQNSEMVIFAVKPHVMTEVLQELKGNLHSGQTLISIAAGISTDQVERALEPAQPAVVRAMPNCAARVGSSATAICGGRYAQEVDLQRGLELFSAIGQVVQVREDLLNAVTGLSGSGPAYLFLVLEALANGGVRLGLTKEQALLLAAQTMKGSAEMVLQGHQPAELKEMVSTPGGTTIEGLYVLEKAGVRGSFMEAVEAAAVRCAELNSR
ncbi:MAG: pyrroline-5-carboxylate reductase [Clostridia bacterium]|nr:pyrroline-5-carboxylate reductase [Clostridia bacterium]